MNTTAFVCSLAVIGLQRAGLLGVVPLPVTLCAILTVLAILGFTIARCDPFNSGHGISNVNDGDFVIHQEWLIGH